MSRELTTSINLPQAAVLGMHAIKEKPVVVNGQIVIRPIMVVALTYDHRLLDGREAVTFLGASDINGDMAIANPQSGSRSTSRTPDECSSPRLCKGQCGCGACEGLAWVKRLGLGVYHRQECSIYHIVQEGQLKAIAFAIVAPGALPQSACFLEPSICIQ